ncbi:MAG: bifunctional demethylmenaquinone methyltransferase/2-methoxy-6-polyprenyl-1,4-benzoquinol methylase UbiE, partial [Cyanobacteria bacterium]|nr:bifunctional demethylmenaquinone methyltransferase/2-methoxy-6-polyprenyl-1,4-benzoquinol methylase UbiE [Cyanobacteriota bacterium]MDW8200520.1 bifunctional demethylmenaquinone methyltransferase/2-methoxy-6-polyprenyl-1,4-benzoquinol methylase UbiE [Cyanobacteriota bacterium SKYGB_h_bin112]
TAEQIRSLFDRIAPVYDPLNQWLSLGQHRIWKQMAVKWSGAQRGDTCLDLCCGSGDIAQLLARQVGPTGCVIGVDFSAAQLAIARQRSVPVQWVEADALALPFPDNYFQAATMGYGLRNLVNIPQGLRELHRVLRLGARAAILDFNRSPDAIVSAFQQWYLNTIVVPVAQQMGFQADYAYLLPSLERFPTGAEQVTLAKQCGFTAAVHYPIAGGTMGMLVVTK